MPFCVICSRHLLPVVSAFPPVRTTWIGLRFPHMYLSPPRSVLPGGPATRSTANAGTPQGTVTALQGGSTPLYLHTLYTDSIASPSSGSRPDTTVLTRAIPIKNDNMYDSFGVSAYSYTGSWSESSPPNYFYNATASKSASGDYALASTYYWPGASYKMNFSPMPRKTTGSTYSPAARTPVLPPSASLFQAMSLTRRIFSWHRRLNWPATPTQPWLLLSTMP